MASAVPAYQVWPAPKRLEEAHAAAAAVRSHGLPMPMWSFKAVGSVLRQHANGVDAAVDTVADSEVDDTEFPAKGTAGFARSSDRTVSRVPLRPPKSWQSFA